MQQTMKLWPFRILECVYVNFLMVAFYIFWYLPAGTPLNDAIAHFVPVFAIGNIGVVVRLWRLSNKPEPPVAMHFPWGKMLKGYAVALLALVLLYRRNLGYMVFLVVATLGVGSLSFVAEWDWRKSRLLRTEQSSEK